MPIPAGHNGLFQDNQVNNITDTNQGQDNSTFRIRRTELNLTMDLNQYLTATVMIDPSREAQSYPNLPDNQANSSIFKRLGGQQNIANLQSGTGSAPRMLQDAYINLPWTTSRTMISRSASSSRWWARKAPRSSSQLDFAERSLVGQLTDARDQGAVVHGSWWGSGAEGRFQYWAGVFDGPGNYLGSGGQFQNRGDDNSDKDFNYRVLVRPLWKDDEVGQPGSGHVFGMGLSRRRWLDQSR